MGLLYITLRFETDGSHPLIHRFFGEIIRGGDIPRKPLDSGPLPHGIELCSRGYSTLQKIFPLSTFPSFPRKPGSFKAAAGSSHPSIFELVVGGVWTFLKQKTNVSEGSMWYMRYVYLVFPVVVVKSRAVYFALPPKKQTSFSLYFWWCQVLQLWFHVEIYRWISRILPGIFHLANRPLLLGGSWLVSPLSMIVGQNGF